MGKLKVEGFKQFKYIAESRLTGAKFQILALIWYHVGKHDHTYIGKTKLLEESGLSATTLDRALADLKKLGWIRVTNRTGTTNEYRLDPSRFGSEDTHPNFAGEGHPNFAGGSPPNFKGDITSIKGESKNLSNNYGLTPETPKPVAGIITPYCDLETKEIKVEVKSHEVLEKIKAATPTIPKKQSPGYLSTFWNSCVSYYFPELGFQKPLTKTQVGQLGHFINHCQQHSPGAVMECVISDWLGFVSYVKEQTGDTKTPATPKVVYLLLYSEEAVQYYLKEEAQEEVTLSAPVTQKFVPVEGEIDSDPDDEDMDSEEYLKFLKGGK